MPAARSSGAMTGNMFVYGTLMADEVLKLLIKRVPDSRPGTICGYRRYCVRQQVYPAIAPSSADSKVTGRVLLDLTKREYDILDVYEADEYYRAAVKPELDDGAVVDADVYVLSDSCRHLLHGEWDYGTWRAQHLQKWVDMRESQRCRLMCCVCAPVVLPARGGGARHLADEGQPDWDYEAFRQLHLDPYYLDMTAAFVANDLPEELRS